MGLLGLEAACPKRSTSRPAPGHKIYSCLLRRLRIVGPNHVWASDITYIPMQHGLLCLTAVVDLFSRNVLSWRLSTRSPAISAFLHHVVDHWAINGTGSAHLFTWQRISIESQHHPSVLESVFKYIFWISWRLSAFYQ
jgi:transposase InsO family protein